MMVMMRAIIGLFVAGNVALVIARIMSGLGEIFATL